MKRLSDENKLKIAGVDDGDIFYVKHQKKYHSYFTKMLQSKNLSHNLKYHIALHGTHNHREQLLNNHQLDYDTKGAIWGYENKKHQKILRSKFKFDPEYQSKYDDGPRVQLQNRQYNRDNERYERDNNIDLDKDE